MITPMVKGSILDIGCGNNKIEGAIGIDIVSGDADFVGDISSADLSEDSFDTVVLSAVINYIKDSEKDKVFSECYRVCKNGGTLIVTCVNPIGGFLHRLLRKDQPKGIGLWPIVGLIESYGFRLKLTKPFMFFLNRLYIFEK